MAHINEQLYSRDGNIFFMRNNTKKIFSHDRTHASTIRDLNERGIIKPVIAVKENHCIAEYWYDSMFTAVHHSYHVLNDTTGKYRLVELA